MDDDGQLAARLGATADRFDELAEVAELMGDDAGALRFRRAGAAARREAMAALDAEAALLSRDDRRRS